MTLIGGNVFKWGHLPRWTVALFLKTPWVTFVAPGNIPFSTKIKSLWWYMLFSWWKCDDEFSSNFSLNCVDLYWTLLLGAYSRLLTDLRPQWNTSECETCKYFLGCTVLGTFECCYVVGLAVSNTSVPTAFQWHNVIFFQRILVHPWSDNLILKSLGVFHSRLWHHHTYVFMTCLCRNGHTVSVA